jgi:hypothetical protein
MCSTSKTSIYKPFPTSAPLKFKHDKIRDAANGWVPDVGFTEQERALSGFILFPMEAIYLAFTLFPMDGIYLAFILFPMDTNYLAFICVCIISVLFCNICLSTGSY